MSRESKYIGIASNNSNYYVIRVVVFSLAPEESANKILA